jgi:hypothetical protein
MGMRVAFGDPGGSPGGVHAVESAPGVGAIGVGIEHFPIISEASCDVAGDRGRFLIGEQAAAHARRAGA